MRAVLLPALLLAWIGSGCAPKRTDPTPARPMSRSEHLAEAIRHEQEADKHTRAAESIAGAPESYSCGDRVLSDQTTSGTERVTSWVPCWSVDREASAAHEQMAEKQRAEAREHRAIARTLVDVERTFCAGMTPDELTHTPFFHRSDVAAAEPYREGDQLVGARITFKPVRGLTGDWMRQALLCHRARMATIGYPTTYMAYDPSLLQHTHIAVDDHTGAVVVTIRADDDADAAVAWARAAALVGATP